MTDALCEICAQRPCARRERHPRLIEAVGCVESYDGLHRALCDACLRREPTRPAGYEYERWIYQTTEGPIRTAYPPLRTDPFAITEDFEAFRLHHTSELERTNPSLLCARCHVWFVSKPGLLCHYCHEQD